MRSAKFSMISRLNWLRPLLVSMVIVALLLAGCSLSESAGPTPEPTPQEPVASGDIVGVASIDEVAINLMESFPIQVSVLANGSLGDDCTEIGSITTEQADNTFLITITTVRPAVAVCNEVETPFDENISINAEGLPAGVYRVLVNGVGDQFELSVDNTLIEESVEPEPVEEDIAASGYSEQEEIVVKAAQTLLADGLGVEMESVEINSIEAADWPDACLGLAQEDELCLLQVTPGYKVEIAYGERVYVLRTDETGQVVRPETKLEVVVTEEVAEAAEAESETGEEETVKASEPATPSCKDKATFVKDMTIKDNTRIQANKAFEKTWRLRNVGTCTWTTDYNVTFAKGEQMEGASPVPMPKEVAPGKNVDITIAMVAPASKGTYKGFWQFENAGGTAFGIGKKGANPFWLKIVVPKSAPKPPEPEKAKLSGIIWHDLCANGQEGQPLPESPPPGCIEVEGSYIGNGVFEEGEPRIGGMEITLGAGTCPASGLALTYANGNGVYEFKNLEAGTYCITIDPLSRHNVPILIPGEWTAPESRDGRQTIAVSEGDAKTKVDFGWDYQFAP
ncbi:MAG: hypothetical protein GY759_24880 [Chloroflexi bacterium]|nr:hypothetical protein [Chloroflexota bacterium]